MRHTAMDYSVLVELISRTSLGEVLYMLAEIADDAKLDTNQLFDPTLETTLDYPDSN